MLGTGGYGFLDRFEVCWTFDDIVVAFCVLGAHGCGESRGMLVRIDVVHDGSAHAREVALDMDSFGRSRRAELIVWFLERGIARVAFAAG